tara:strand:+ start:14018 stop:14407 length:390 start_codon:yes stop_codon:yes gene_type:complete
MKWEKTGKCKNGRFNYTASCDGEKTTFNLDGMAVTTEFTSQEEAVKFLIVNGYMPFDIDGSSKSIEEVEIPEEEEEEEEEAQSLYDLKEEIANEVEEEKSACGLEEECECEDDECEIEEDWEDDLEDDS